jgi:hypothetical protein
MTTLAAHFSDYDSGIVTRDGFLSLRDAETYDQVSSISACSSCLSRISRHLENGPLQLFEPNGNVRMAEDMATFRAWAKEHFPNSLDYLDHYGR